ncbi:MAG: translation initiation factor IF-2 subunit alpha [Halobacteriaceae archaeon]
MKYEGWPEKGDLVVGNVVEIEDFGVFVDLEEYKDKQGLVHVSEVASGWIKNVRDHVSVGQKVVAKVIDVDKSSQQIDLSLKDVNEHQQKEKIQEWKNEQKADNWLTEDIPDDKYRNIVNSLLEEFGSVYNGFEQAAIHGNDALADTDLSKEEIDAIVSTARENVAVPYVNVTGYMTLECPESDGVDTIKEALKAAEGDGDVPEEVDLEVTYVGSPEYRIRVQAPNYKRAESALEASAERAKSVIESSGGSAEFHRERQGQEQ